MLDSKETAYVSLLSLDCGVVQLYWHQLTMGSPSLHQSSVEQSFSCGPHTTRGRSLHTVSSLRGRTGFVYLANKTRKVE